MSTTTRVVRINVVVTDESGQPVRNLQKNDFTILDDGAPQRITFFSPIDAEGPLTAPRPLGPGVYSNRPADYGAPPSVTVILFDTRGSPWISRGYNVAPVRDLLRQIQPRDRVALYVLTNRLHVIHSFTSDASDIVSAIQSYEAQLGHARGGNADESTGYPALDRALSGNINSSSPGSARPRGEQGYSDAPTIDALDAIARQLSGIPGRRQLVWVTDFVGDVELVATSDMEQYLRLWREHSPHAPLAYPLGVNILEMARLMNDAGIAVYAVDAVPLQKGRAELKSDLDAPPMKVATPTARQHFEMMSLEHQYLIGLAKRTGGRSFLKPRNVNTALQRAINDARFSYTLAYSPSDVKWDAEWRHIRVKVDRLGVAILARKGYLALPSDLPRENHTEFLDSIAASPLDASELLFRVVIVPPNPARSTAVGLTVHIPPRCFAEALTAEPDGHWTGRFEIVIMQLDKHERAVDITPRQVNADLPPSKYAAVSKIGWNLPVRLAIKPGAETLCVILHDENSDEVGSIHIPIAAYADAPTSSARN